MTVTPKANALSVLRPDVAAQWHPARNASLTPDDVAVTSNKPHWWLGACGHEWEAKVSNRTAQNSGCPFCSNKRVLTGFNDLATTHPHLAAEWHPDNTLPSTEMLAGSAAKAWWIGSVCGHTWDATPKDRSQSGAGCRFCAGKGVLVGFNDLTTTHPHLAAEWHPDKNSVAPSEVTYGSKKMAWWRAECGHEFDATPNQRTASIAGCPVCRGMRVVVGVNDLASMEPGLAAEWHPTKNDRTPTQVTTGSNYKAWWLRPECGHEWQAFVVDRAGAHRSACPRCANRTSKGEAAVLEFLRALLGPDADIEVNNREHGVEFDLLVRQPGKRTLAIEFNGTYWHSEKFAGRTHHAEERSIALAAGYRFFAVWEDDWRDRRNVVEAALATRLGVGQQHSGLGALGARSLTPGVLGKDRAQDFLAAHHIQGRTLVPLSHYALLDRISGQPQALLSIRRRSNGTYEIARYATARTVAGGFTRLLAHAERTHGDVKEWVTFADHSISEGGLYEQNGFAVDATLPPDYSYAANRTGWRREHKSNYRLKRFRDDPSLAFRPGATEKELAAENGLLRVWDYGKTRYIKRLPR